MGEPRVWRWLGLDATFAVAAAGHVSFLSALAWLASNTEFTTPLGTDAWMFGIGCTAASASLLALWLIGGPGRLSTRFLWTILLVQGTWYLTANAIFNRENSFFQFWFPFLPPIVLLASSIVLAVAGVLRFGGHWRVTPDKLVPAAKPQGWQFVLGDLMRWTVTTGLIVAARQDVQHVGRNFISLYTIEYSFASVVGIAAIQNAFICLVGVWAILRERPHLGPAYFVAVVATVIPVIATGYLNQHPQPDDWQWSLRRYGCIGGGALVVVLGTLLPMWAWGWRIVRPIRRPAVA